MDNELKQYQEELQELFYEGELIEGVVYESQRDIFDVRKRLGAVDIDKKIAKYNDLMKSRGYAPLHRGKRDPSNWRGNETGSCLSDCPIDVHYERAKRGFQMAIVSIFTAIFTLFITGQSPGSVVGIVVGTTTDLIDTIAGQIASLVTPYGEGLNTEDLKNAIIDGLGTFTADIIHIYKLISEYRGGGVKGATIAETDRMNRLGASVPGVGWTGSETLNYAKKGISLSKSVPNRIRSVLYILKTNPQILQRIANILRKNAKVSICCL